MRWLQPQRTWLLLLGALLLNLAAAHSTRRNRLSYVTRAENATILTPSHRVHAGSSFDLTFRIHDGNQDIRFVLEPNHDLIPASAHVTHFNAAGEVEKVEPLRSRGHRVYMGTAWVRDVYDQIWEHAGWARIVVKRDGKDPLFEGAFKIFGDYHHIQTRTAFLKTRHELDPLVDWDGPEFMVVHRDSDVDQGFRTQGLMGRGLDQDAPSCNSDKVRFNTDPQHPINRMIREPMPTNHGLWGAAAISNLFGLEKRADASDVVGGSGNSAGVNLYSTIGSTDGCPTTREVALMGVATDCTYTGDFNSKDDAESNVVTQINSASELYQKTFNITLGLANLTVLDANCPGTPQDSAKWNVACSDSVTIEDRLNDFSEWRGQSPRGNDSNALWTLLTTCETGSSVGLAWLGQLCQAEATQNANDGGWVSGANVVARTSTEWKVMAHEIGHTFGAVHDCTSSTCSANQDDSAQCCPLSSSTCDAGGKYLMNPSTSDDIENFSPCSVGNICSAMKRKSVDTSCLTNNRDVSTYTGQECGNGIVEDGEDCDCGGDEGCASNSCCTTECKFKNDAVCDDSNEECCSSCQYASSSTVCRASNGECDPEEKCTGKSPTCPADVTSDDGTDCGDGLQCASGQCTSRDQQCQTVMGSQAGTNDTHSCDDDSCVLTCQSPKFGSNVCYGMQQNFLDGTPCGSGGSCQNGQCSGSSTLGEVKSWIDKHKTLVIGLAAGIGGLLLLSILSCCWSRCRKGRRPKRAGNVPPGWQPMGQASPPPGWMPGHPVPVYGGPPPPQQWGGSARYA